MGKKYNYAKSWIIYVVTGIVIAGSITLLVIRIDEFESHSYVADIPIYNVQRVLMHEEGNYDFLIFGQDSVSLQEIQINGSKTLYADVPPDKNIWLDLHYKVYSPAEEKQLKANPKLGFSHCLGVEIHLHSAKDINGAGWDHGKSGKGQTNVIE